MNPYSAGVIVYFRALDSSNVLARSVHPKGRKVMIRDQDYYPEDYVILDEDDMILGVYPREWVACILPIDTTGPANVPSEQARYSNPTTAEARDPQGVTGRAKRFDS